MAWKPNPLIKTVKTAKNVGVSF